MMEDARLLEQMLNQVPLLVSRFTGDGTLLYVNRALSKLFGLPREELLGCRFVEMVPEPDREAVADMLNRLQNGAEPATIMHQLETRNGDMRYTRWVNVSAPPLPDGTPTFFAYGEDVTARILAERATRESESRLQGVLAALPDLCLVLDEDGCYRQVMGTRHQELLARPEEDLLGRTLHDVFDAETADRFLTVIHNVLRSGEIQVFEYELPVVAGLRWFEGRVSPLGADLYGKPAVIWLSRDITHRKQLEMDLVTNEKMVRDLYRMVRLMMDNATDLIWAKDTAGRYLFANRAMCDILLQAKDPDEVVGKTDMFFAERERKAHPDNPQWHTFGEICADSDRVVLESGQPGSFEEFGHVRGKLLYLDVHKAPIRDESGEIIGTVGSARDITARKMMEATATQIEEQLARSEASYRELFESAPEAIYIQDEDGVFLDVNQKACDMYGFDRAYFIGRSPADLAAPGRNDLNTIKEMVRQAFNGEPQQFEFWAVRKNGEVFPKDVIVTPGTYFGRKVVIAFSRDISHRKQVEEQLRQAQKMEAIGRLAGGVAHDFNNLLTPILGYAEMMMQDLVPDHPHYKRLAAIRRAADTARNLTQQLLAFGRKQMLNVQVVDLNETVRHSLHILQRTLEESVHVEADTASGPLWVKADPTQLEQIIMNLAINARDAMPDGGTVRVETRMIPGSGETPARVLLAVHDTGQGMDEQTRANIFEPFFTTKELKHGTGLGLATVYGIVKQHGGDIQVESAPGQGSTFRVTLPAAVDVPDREQGPDTAEPPAGEGSGATVLVVEDNRMVLDLATSVLREHGYAVIGSAHPHEALRLAAEHDGPIHLLVTDVVMPGMNGSQLAATLKRERPETAVLYMSGYDEDILPDSGDEAPPFIRKPFQVHAFVRMVQHLLDKQSG